MNLPNLDSTFNSLLLIHMKPLKTAHMLTVANLAIRIMQILMSKTINILCQYYNYQKIRSKTMTVNVYKTQFQQPARRTSAVEDFQ